MLQSGLWRFLRAVGTAKVRSTGMRRTAPGSVPSHSAGVQTARGRRKVTGRTKTEVRDKLKKLQAETDAGLKTSASYTVANGSPGKIIPRISRALAAAAPNRAGSAYVHHGACGQQRPG